MPRSSAWLLPLLFAAAVLIAADSQGDPDARDLIAKGEDLYLARSESLDFAKKAIDTWERALVADPESEEALIRIAKAYYYLGRYTLSEQDKEALFDKGRRYGERAVKADAKNAGAHYWLAVNMGKWGEVRGLLKSLSQVKPMRDHLEAARSIDPRYYYGGPDRVLGRLYFKAPAVVSIGNKKKAEEHLRRSLAMFPDYSLTLLYLAEVLIDAGKDQEARSLLERLLSLEPMPGFEQELETDKEAARELLKKFQ